ncbi:hypothetical protein JST97_29600 [bacterium]|nr:hypothetical protein [bacterium]
MSSSKSLELTQGVVRQEIGAELLIYHPAQAEACLLSAPARRVYESIGSFTEADLQSALSGENGLETDCAAALRELWAHDLLRTSQGFDRREMLKQTARLAAVPLIASLLVPPPAAAASGGTVTFNTAGTFSYVVPLGVTSVNVTVTGGDGGLGGSMSPGAIRNALGAKGETKNNPALPVTGGETLTVVVGGPGGQGGQGNSFGPGAGGAPDGQPGTAGSSGFSGGGGGGGSGGFSSVTGGSGSISAQGGTGGGGFAGPLNSGQPGNFGGAGAIGSSPWGNGGAGGKGATGTGDGSVSAGFVTITPN